MIEDVFEGIFRVVGRFVGYILYEIVFEIFIRGTGCCIYKLFTNKEPDPEGLTVLFSGFLFWMAIISLGYMIYKQF